MRELTDHIVGGLNDSMMIHAVDEPGDGGACHEYKITSNGPLTVRDDPVHNIKFQKGPLAEAGVNGITNEALLTVVIDRLRGFQSGEFSCRENAIALTNIEQALMWLQKRTRDRLKRGVEGTNAK